MLTALDLSRDPASPDAALVRDALVDVGALDAYAARDVLNHQPMRSHLTSGQARTLHAVLTTSGLGAGSLSTTHSHALTAAVDMAESALRRQL
ncbi:hypothetical protein [Embleya sp. NPDC005575]|uniref:hypothetical protein n=1 Tax=Embleya sp. NPDC005575 TaxID=3156892 RepID=UPI0033AD6963